MQGKCCFLKKIVTLPLLIIFILCFPLFGEAEPLISLACPDQISCGTEITIPLMISDSPVIDSLVIELNFSSQMTYKDCDFQGCLTQDFDYIDCNSPETGRLIHAGFSTEAPISEGSDGCLGKLTFDVADQCSPDTLWIVISELFDDLKGIETEPCGSPPPTTTTSIRRPSTTTTPPTTTSIPVCTVTVSPPSVTLTSGETQQFEALTHCDDEVVEGTYNWEITPASTIGSSINSEGLLVAGSNETELDIQETVSATDTAHDDALGAATVTITPRETPLPECEVTITPSTETIYTGETLVFSAVTICEGEVADGSYTWSVNSSIGSNIDISGLYISGHTDVDVTDTVTVTDTAHGNSTHTASVNVIGTFIEACPDPMLRSRWIGLFRLMSIQGTNTTFAPFTTKVSFDPKSSVFALPPLILCPELIWQVVHINPSWLSESYENESIKVTVTTGVEAVSDEVEIRMLPVSLDK